MSKNIILLLLSATIFISSCNNTKEIEQSQEIATVPIEYIVNFERQIPLNTLEPTNGLLFGIYYPHNIDFPIKDYEFYLSKKPNQYVYEYTLGTDFEIMYIIDCIARDKMPYIKIITSSYNKYNIAQIKYVSSILRSFNVDCYVELFPNPSETEFDSEKYKNYFEESAKLLKEDLKNVAIIFTPNNDELIGAEEFLPSSEYIDFIGFDYIGKILETNPDIYEDFFLKFDYIYDLYSNEKPIFITTFALSYFSDLDNTYHIKNNINYINEIFNIINKNYKRVKGVNFYDVDAREFPFYNSEYNFDNYSFTDNDKILDNFNILTDSNLFLSTYEKSDTKETIYYAYDALLVNDEYYISSSIINDENLISPNLSNENDIYIYNENKYYNIKNIFKNNENYYIEIDNINKIISIY